MKASVLVILATVLVACGSYDAPPPSPGPPGAFDITATEKDHAVTMHVGQKIELVLHAGQGMKPWTHPTSSDTAVLNPIVDPAATAVRGVTLAAFQAKAKGQVEVTANAGPDCAPNQPCAQFLAVYNLKVTITSSA
jgi:transposase